MPQHPGSKPSLTKPCRWQLLQLQLGKSKKGRGATPQFVLDKTAPDDIIQLQAQWLANNDRVAPTIHQDKQMWKLSIINMDVNLWLKAMAPSDKKEFCQSRDLVYKVILPPNGGLSPLEGQHLVTLLGNTLQ
jgi:hypothetical protein